MKQIFLVLPLIRLAACDSKLENIQADKSFCVSTSDQAIKKTKIQWLKLFGEEIFNKKPFVATLQDDTLWIIQGTIANSDEGGVPYAELNATNCKFEVITHGK